MQRIGYKGRTTVSEVIAMTKEMEELITEKPTTSEIEEPRDFRGYDHNGPRRNPESPRRHHDDGRSGTSDGRIEK